MHAEVFSGQLVYVDTEEGRIMIMDRTDKRMTTLNIDADTNRSWMQKWEDLIGDDVDAIVIDGKVKSVSPIVEEE